MASRCELHAKLLTKINSKSSAKAAAPPRAHSADSRQKLAQGGIRDAMDRFDSPQEPSGTDLTDNDGCDSGDEHESASAHSPTTAQEKRQSFWHPYQGPLSVPKEALLSITPNELLSASTVSTSTELGEIQLSVQRLREQRTQVEYLGQRNEELERQLGYQKAENETLQRVVFTLRGAEQENVAYLQSVKILEQRARSLEEICNDKKLELQVTTEKLSYAEKERDQLRQSIEQIRQDHEEDVRILEETQNKLQQHIEQLEHSWGAQNGDQKRQERHWRQKLKSVDREHSHSVDMLQKQLEESCTKSMNLGCEVHELEEQVQNLLATTVRQTTMIEDCDRVMAETKAQLQQAQRNYEEQLQLNGELSTKIQRLEAQIASLKLANGSGTVELERKIIMLENKSAMRKKRMQDAQTALLEKQKDIETMQRKLLQDRNQHRVDEVTNTFLMQSHIFKPLNATPLSLADEKELHYMDLKLKSEISELQIALRDASDEKSLLSEQVIELQERLEKERKDRSRWATARLKLLAEFCDEESKISSALNHHAGSVEDRRASGGASSGRKSKQARNIALRHASDDKRYDGDNDSDSEKQEERRQSSIVFG